MAPGQSCNDLLHDSPVRPRLGARAHVLQVARREALDLGERGVQIGTEPVDDMRAPTFPLLPCEDVAADGPVEQNKFCVDRERGLDLRGADAGLQIVEPRGVAGRQAGAAPCDV